MRQRFVEADVLRGLVILGVVVIHVSPPLMQHPKDLPTTLISMAFNQVSRFALPAFLFTSGFGLVIPFPASARWSAILNAAYSSSFPLISSGRASTGQST